VLARAKATSVNGLTEAGVVQSGKAATCACCKWAEYAARLGPGNRHPRASSVGSPAPADPRPQPGRRNRRRRSCSPACGQPAPRPSASSPTASTPSASARAGPKTPAPTTNSSPIENAAYAHEQGPAQAGMGLVGDLT
jgi:hypothetical protein